MPDEFSWVKRLARGDEQALVAIYDRYQGRIYRFAMQMTGDPSMAQDATQEVFLTLLRKPDAFQPERGTLASFLFGVAKNHVRNRLRHERRYVELEPAEADGLTAGREDIAELSGGEVREAVLALPGEYREIVVLCEFQGMSYAEAAAALETPIGTVRSRLHRDRALLARKLAPALKREQPRVRS